MRYTVTLERGTDGGYMAWVHELLGCAARGASKAEVEAKIRPAIAEFLTWTRSARVTAEDVQFAVVTELESPVPVREADTALLLEPDRHPLTHTAWTQAERLLRLSRADLLHTLGELDETALAFKPAGSPRSVGEQLMHIGMVELLYVVWTFHLESPQGMAEFLRWARRLTTARMRTLVRADRGAETHAFWAGASRPEAWTARKAARRLVWHERLHLRAIRRLLGRRRSP